MALGREIVDFIRLRVLQQANEVRRIRHVPVVEDHLGIGFMRILVKMVDTRRVADQRCPPLESMDRVALRQQQFSEQGAVLASDAGDERRARA